MDGVECPTCDSKEITPRLKRRGYRCRDCRQDFTVKTGTIFEGSNITLDIWLLAMYQVISAKKGVSILQLSKELGVSQKTAWFMLHRIRGAYNKTTKPVGIVENDETYIEGLDKNKNLHRYVNEFSGPLNEGNVKIHTLDGPSSRIVD